MQAIFLFQLPHDDFLSLVIPAVAGHAAIETNPVRQNMDMFVFGVGVPGDDVLIMVEAHAL